MSIEEALDKIELKDKSILAKMYNARSFKEANEAVEELYSIVKKQRKKLAKKYHPDIGGDEEKFKKINDICDKLLTIKAEPQQRRVSSFTVIVRTGEYYDTKTTSSTSTAWWSSF